MILRFHKNRGNVVIFGSLSHKGTHRFFDRHAFLDQNEIRAHTATDFFFIEGGDQRNIFSGIGIQKFDHNIAFFPVHTPQDFHRSICIQFCENIHCFPHIHLIQINVHVLFYILKDFSQHRHRQHPEDLFSLLHRQLFQYFRNVFFVVIFQLRAETLR